MEKEDITDTIQMEPSHTPEVSLDMKFLWLVLIGLSKYLSRDWLVCLATGCSLYLSVCLSFRRSVRPPDCLTVYTLI